MTEPMKTERQYPSTLLEKEAVQYVANDDLAMFADDDTRMIYEHYYIKGYEKAVAAERERIKEKVKKFQPDFDKAESYQHGFHDAIQVLIDSL